jgi:hypothetical protein
VSEWYEVATWLVYAVATVMMLTVVVATILAGLALRLVAEFLLELGNGREDDDSQHADEDSTTPLEQRN